MASIQEYAVDEEIVAFFNKTTATIDECHAKARELTNSSKVVPVAIQGICSYSIYAGESLEFVVQCRLKSLVLETKTTSLASDIFGQLVPSVSFHGMLGHGAMEDQGGQDGKQKEPLLVYLMSRMPGITHLDFVLSHDMPRSSPEYFPLRQNFTTGVAHFFAISWLAEQTISPQQKDSLRQQYTRDLNLLHASLPARFQPVIQKCIQSIDSIMNLPMVLLHKDFGDCNLLVDKDSCSLTGVIDWAEAIISPFGLNLHSLESFFGHMHLRDGWTRFPDHEALKTTFWSSFQEEIGGISDKRLGDIKMARAVGLLLSHGFTSRLANQLDPVPIKDDEQGRYNLMSLDAFLIDIETRFDGLDWE